MLLVLDVGPRFLFLNGGNGIDRQGQESLKGSQGLQRGMARAAAIPSTYIESCRYKT